MTVWETLRLAQAILIGGGWVPSPTLHFTGASFTARRMVSNEPRQTVVPQNPATNTLQLHCSHTLSQSKTSQILFNVRFFA